MNTSIVYRPTFKSIHQVQRTFKVRCTWTWNHRLNLEMLELRQICLVLLEQLIRHLADLL
jgi:hypothetical protein